jgi:hypothetical protein
MPRDDFAKEVKDILARRVGVQCSNPNCRQPTSGPQSDPKKALNIGVAAHITAASEGGARYDRSLPPAERRSFENAIWLCQNCAKLIDNDAKHYTVDLLRRWKLLSEEAARGAVEKPMGEPASPLSDVEMIRFYAQAFDRPVFQDQFRQEGSMEAFDKAIEDTITAINTGCLRARDGEVLSQSKGKAFLRDAKWRTEMDVIVNLLRAIRSRFDLAMQLGQIQVGSPHAGKTWYCIYDSAVADWMDSSRLQVLELFAGVCREACVPQLKIQGMRTRNW